MKYSTATVFALAGMSHAVPLAQFSLPSFEIPSFPSPSGGAGLGGFSIPSLPGSSGPTPQPDATAPAATPTQTSTGNGGNSDANCTPQGNGGGSTEDGVKNKNCCTDITVIFARGTSEGGNMGTIAGPPMVKSLRNKLGADKVTVQGVDYAASAAGNADLGASGSPKMAASVKAALDQCPSTKIIVSGYSQGGMVVHNAFSAQGLKASQVTAAVNFGDPFSKQSVGDLPAEKVKQFCGTSDTLCGGGDVPGGHLSYGSAADDAADFIISAAGLS